MIPCGGITLELMRNRAKQSPGISPAPESRQLLGGVSGGVIITYLCPSCLQSCRLRDGASGWEGLALCLPSPFSWHSEPPTAGKPTPFPQALSMIATFGNGGHRRGMLSGLRVPAASWQMGRGSSSETSFPQLGWGAQWGRGVFSALQCPLTEG